MAKDNDKAAWPLEHRLSRPAQALDETVESLTLVEPTAAQLLKCGVFDGTVTGEQMLDLVAELAKKPPALIRALPGVDMVELTTRLSRIFRKAAS
jgi:hypothetical protein